MSWSAKSLTGKTQNHLSLFDGCLVNSHILTDLKALSDTASQAGFEFTIASSFRDFDRQTFIWNEKFLGKRPLFDKHGKPIDIPTLSEKEKVQAILLWSALPGGSRHHWGTDLDVFAKNLLPKDTSLALEPWEYLTGHQAAFYQWLKPQLENFNFFFPYAEDRGGVGFEPWHISHRLESQTAIQALTLDLLAEEIATSDMKGKDIVIDMLEHIYTQYIQNICED